MYVILDVNTGIQIGITAEPEYVYIKDPAVNVLEPTVKFNAGGIVYKGKAYNLSGCLRDIGAEKTVRLINKPDYEVAVELTDREEKTSALLDYLSAMTGIDLPD